MSTPAALPTTYSGVAFRSRLEARVAAAFDRVGIGWEYEPEGLDLDGIHYLPDFRVAGTWIEIKPSREASDGKIERLATMTDAPCYLVFPWDLGPADPYRDHDILGGRFHSHLMRVNGPGSYGSAVWARCPQCNQAVPWPLSGEELPPCCGRYSTRDQWWDSHYAMPQVQLGLPLPQYQDGQMIFEPRHSAPTPMRGSDIDWKAIAAQVETEHRFW